MQGAAEAAPMPPQGPARRSLRPRTVLLGLIIAGLAVAAIAALPLVASVAWSPFDHFECRPGTVVAERRLWTPLVMVNAPYGGNASATVHESTSVSATISAHNGGAEGFFVLLNWSVAQSLRVLAAGPGTNAECPEFLATPGLNYNMYAGYDLLPANTTSDTDEPTALTPDPNLLGYGSVAFHNGYVSGDGVTMTTCSIGREFLQTTSSRTTVEVPFTQDGRTAMAKATLEYAANYSYEFPGGAGTWSIDDLNTGNNAPGGGYAFTFTPCP